MYGILIPVSGGDPIPLRKEELTIGRKEGCDIVLRFSNVSSKHCQLVLSSGYWYILDLKSTNGVKINGAKVTDHRVDPGATLAISKHLFTLEYDPAKNGATGAPPADVLRQEDLMSRSLLEKAGLQRPSLKRQEEPEENDGDSGSTQPDMPIIISGLPPLKPGEKRDFFSKLKFD